MLKKTRSPQCGRCGRGGAGPPRPREISIFGPRAHPRPRIIWIFGPRARRARGKLEFLAPAPAASAGVRATNFSHSIYSAIESHNFKIKASSRCKGQIFVLFPNLSTVKSAYYTCTSSCIRAQLGSRKLHQTFASLSTSSKWTERIISKRIWRIMKIKTSSFAMWS